MNKRFPIMALAFALSALALAVPLSTAGPSQQALVREKLGEIGAWAVPAPSTVAVASSGDGFQWNDAGIGAVFAFGIMLVGATCVVTIRRWHGPVAH